MRVLLVEDDDQMARLLQAGLEEDGVIVDRVSTGDEAVAAAVAEAYDVVSLDLLIPDRDGIEVCAELRRRRVATPILMLTALDSIRDRVRGLESGADDYLVKPFAFEEYLARLHALSRRHVADRSGVIEAGTVRVDTGSGLAQAGGQELLLTVKEFAILEFFCRNQGRLLHRDQVAQAVWGFAYSSDSNLVDVYVARLRRKLRATGTADPFVTVRHGGYRFQPT